MVFWWSICGGMRGKRGGFATRFQGSKNTPRIPDLFFGLPDLGNGLVSREIIGRLSSSCLVFFRRRMKADAHALSLSIGFNVGCFCRWPFLSNWASDGYFRIGGLSNELQSINEDDGRLRFYSAAWLPRMD